MKLDWKIATVTAIFMALIVVFASVFFFSYDMRLFALLNGLAAFLALSVPMYVKYKEHMHMKKVEDAFPQFLDDLTNNIRVGMPLPAALNETASNDYGELAPHVKEMSAKLEWGIPFSRILQDFAAKTGSMLIARTAKGIIQAHDSGGALSDVMSAMSSAVRELDRIKKERSASIYSQMLTGYFIFFVFIGIMVMMSRFLLPLLASGLESQADVERLYREIFLSLALIQGIFAGLGIGKMSEGTISAGIKHSFVLAVVGYTVLAVA